jgi:hypothetical protein
MNVLNVEVSYFKTNDDTANPVTVNLLAFLRSTRHLAKVEQVRAAKSAVEKEYFKERLPGITPHGVFSYRADKNLVKHSGLIQGDIDFQDNPYSPESMKRVISKIANVAYCGLSTSGKGVWFLMPIKDTSKHREHYAAMVADFGGLGFVLDTSVSSPSSFRYFSHDPNAFFNLNAKPYKNTMEQPVRLPREARAKPQNGESSPAMWAANYLIDNAVNVANGYNDYMRIAAACKFEFGEDGRNIALDLLENSPEFLASRYCRNFDSHWATFKREGGKVATGGTLVKMAQRHRGASRPQCPTMPHSPRSRTARPVEIDGSGQNVWNIRAYLGQGATIDRGRDKITPSL